VKEKSRGGGEQRAGREPHTVGASSRDIRASAEFFLSMDKFGASDQMTGIILPLLPAHLLPAPLVRRWQQWRPALLAGLAMVSNCNSPSTRLAQPNACYQSAAQQGVGLWLRRTTSELGTWEHHRRQLRLSKSKLQSSD